MLTEVFPPFFKSCLSYILLILFSAINLDAVTVRVISEYVFDYIHRVALGGVRLETDAGRSSVDNEAGFFPVNLGIFTIIIFNDYFPEVVIRYELKNHIVFDLFQCSRLILV